LKYYNLEEDSSEIQNSFRSHPAFRTVSQQLIPLCKNISPAELIGCCTQQAVSHFRDDIFTRWMTQPAGPGTEHILYTNRHPNFITLIWYAGQLSHNFIILFAHKTYDKIII